MLLEVLVERRACGHIEIRQVVHGGPEVDVAAFRDDQRVAEGLREIAEDGGHLLGGLQEELLAVIPQALGIVHRLSRADAQQDVVRHVVAVIAGSARRSCR